MHVRLKDCECEQRSSVASKTGRILDIVEANILWLTLVEIAGLRDEGQENVA